MPKDKSRIRKVTGFLPEQEAAASTGRPDAPSFPPAAAPTAATADTSFQRGRPPTPPPTPAAASPNQPAAAPGTSGEPAPTRSSKGSAKSGEPAAPSKEAPKPTEPTTSVTLLAKFLADNVALYFDKITDSKAYPDQQTLADKILEGSGASSSASKAALAAFVDKVESGQGAPEFKTELNLDPDLEAAKKIDDPKNYAGKTEYGISAGEIGLIDFLKFSYVVKRPGGEATGVEAAKKIGLEAEYDNNTLIPQNKIWQALCRIGSIVPFPFIVLQPPAEGIPEGSILEIGSGSDPVKLRLKGKTGGASLILLGVEQGQRITIGPGTWGATFTKENSKKLLKMTDPQPVRLQTTSGDLNLESVTIEIGTTLDFSDAERSARTMPMTAGEVSATAKNLSGEASQQQATRLASSDNPNWGGQSKPFELQNVYLDATGFPRLNKVDVVLVKRITKNRDVFELSAQKPGSAILIPIRLSADAAAMAEVPSITALTFLGPPKVETSQEVTVFYPVSMLEWQFEGRQFTYGDTAPPISLVDFTPASAEDVRELMDKGINIRTNIDPAVVQDAIRRYVGDDNNPVGTALYRSSALNYAMNTIPKPRR